jgi:hypothetical protein
VKELGEIDMSYGELAELAGESERVLRQDSCSADQR